MLPLMPLKDFIQFSLFRCSVIEDRGKKRNDSRSNKLFSQSKLYFLAKIFSVLLTGNM